MKRIITPHGNRKKQKARQWVHFPIKFYHDKVFFAACQNQSKIKLKDWRNCPENDDKSDFFHFSGGIVMMIF
jgi:hypothetical protein